MGSYIDKSFIVASGFAATVTIVGMSWLAYAGAAQADKVTDDDLLTAEKCIGNNTINGSVEPFEESLVAEGIVNTDLDKITITHGMCEEIIKRSPGGSPIARAAVVGNLTQELQIIKKSMEDASGKDVNGDGMVNTEDKRIADSASFAATHAARETLRRKTEEGSIDGGGIEELDAVPAAHLARQPTTSASSAPTTSASDEPTTSASGEPTTPASGEPTTATSSPTYYYASPSASATAPAAKAPAAKAPAAKAPAAKAPAAKAPAAKAPAAKGRATAASNAGLTPYYEEVRANASAAAREKGADKQAAATGGQCAATVLYTDATLHLIRGYMIFKAPAKELHWKDHDRAQLRVLPKAFGSIEQLEQELDQAEGTGKVKSRCLHLGNQMKPKVIYDDGLDIKLLVGKRKQDVRLDRSTAWTWDINASKRGAQHLSLNVTAYVSSLSDRGRIRSVPGDPLFDDYINVSATPLEVFTDFVGRHWSVLVPILLTILTAIIIPFVLPWWKRRNQPSEPRDRPSSPRDDG
jgi:hypothetical protein